MFDNARHALRCDDGIVLQFYEGTRCCQRECAEESDADHGVAELVLPNKQAIPEGDV
jgi:hypothetical protein